MSSALPMRDPIGSVGPALADVERSKTLSASLDSYFCGVRRAATAVREMSAEVNRATDELLDLFAADAVLAVDDVKKWTGRKEIGDFYRGGVLAEPNFYPRPVEGSRVCLEDSSAIVCDIFLHSKNRSRLVRDTFTYDTDNKIIRMHIQTISDHQAPL